MQRRFPTARFGRISAPEPEWLALAVPEERIEPDLPIIDPHHHLWLGYAGVASRYMLEDYLADAQTGHHNVVATLFVECDSMYRADGPAELKPLGEVEFVNGCAAMSASGQFGPARVAAGIVGHADLTLGSRAGAVLEAEMAITRRFVGIRHAAAFHADARIGNAHGIKAAGLYRRPDFRSGFAQLARLGLTFDAWAYHTQLDDVAGLARAFPGTSIVMNHVGGPLGYGPYAGRRDATFAEWKQAITALAACPNVYVKLGGMTNRLAAFDYMQLPRPPSSAELAEYWRAYILTAIELFGAGRCMFESNFPVDKMGITFTALWNAFKRLTANASADEKAALFAGAARRAYRLSA
jgi:predicted TIM-barrel fold metal-dependent hydrolase